MPQSGTESVLDKKPNLHVFGQKFHLHDTTLGPELRPACDTKDVKLQDIVSEVKFAATPAENQCRKCEEQLRKAQIYNLSCGVCHEKFPSVEALETHVHLAAHALFPVAYRDGRPTFTVTTEGFHGDHGSSGAARTLARAYAEVEEHFPKWEFDFHRGDPVYAANGMTWVCIYTVIAKSK